MFIATSHRFYLAPEERHVRSSHQAQALLNDSRPSPAVLVVPTYHNVAGADVAPPHFEVFPRNIERGRSDQMIEHDCVLFAPAKSGYRTQVVVVEEMLRKR
jgi:hypothetical protein